RRVLVVFKYLLSVDRSGPTRMEDVGESLASDLWVNEDLADRIPDRRRRVGLREREHEPLRRGPNLERSLPVVVPHRPNLHNSPSDSSCPINSKMRRVAAPFIAFRLSRSHFTISLPSR